ncbi:polynucleotide adenylyltransferase PcnB [Inmirania thermothiophila]|uniref:Poly(A) polymerase I n=1 Tax=Inmirania thermothiophila TaxID=1750597 RepID=A0A3N1Y233_9GAMM|nr:polynucleotide adenylyltransferase PcnB [Inmirania thermothiophila]ROR32879.1 poly(A) polymerase [Inmirania thermothiophila]
MESPALTRQPIIVPRPEHNISRASISDNALKVLYRLRKAGHEAYLVGGSVRDLLLGREPKDFDVATDARPERVREIFRNCRLIGRRFRLAHVHFKGEIVEVATFRALHDGEGEREVVDGIIVADNLYGTLEEDAFRRDFTVNALYYNIDDFSVVDYVGGMADLRAGVLRLIGEPERRYREDPVRMLRAARFAAKLGFRIDPDTAGPILRLAPLLREVPPARLFEEVLKLFLGGYGLESFERMRALGLFGELFPEVEALLAEEEAGYPRTFLAHALANTDERVGEGRPVTPAFLLACLLWEPVRRQAAIHRAAGMAETESLHAAAEDVIARCQARVAIPRRFATPMREIWTLQPRFARRSGRRPQRFLTHPRFRAAYDFLLLRARGGEDVEELAQWWTRFQEADRDGQQRMMEGRAAGGRRRRRRRRRKTAE